MDAAVDAGTGQFELNEEQRAIQEMAQGFAADRVAPNALDWDRRKYFPADGSSPSQRAASVRKKCPLEKISTSSPTARTRFTTRSARAAI